MANTYVDYIGDNTTTSFAFPFPYLDDTHIVVQLDTVALAGGKFVDQTVTTHYTIQTSPSAAIIFVTAPATGDRIRIKRDSASDTALVDFENGSVLTEVELDRAYLHNLYLNEEIEEGSGKNTMTKDPVDGNYDADLAKIKNLADPTNPQDAVTKNYADITFVDVAGDTMTGTLNMGGNTISNAVLTGATIAYNDVTSIQSNVRGEISATGDLSYNSTTGVLSYTQPTNVSTFTNDSNYITLAQSRSGISVSGSLAYNSSTGVISYTQPTNVSTFTNDANYVASGGNISTLTNDSNYATVDDATALSIALG